MKKRLALLAAGLFLLGVIAAVSLTQSAPSGAREEGRANTTDLRVDTHEQTVLDVVRKVANGLRLVVNSPKQPPLVGEGEQEANGRQMYSLLEQQESNPNANESADVTEQFSLLVDQALGDSFSPEKKLKLLAIQKDLYNATLLIEEQFEDGKITQESAVVETADASRTAVKKWAAVLTDDEFKRLFGGASPSDDPAEMFVPPKE